MDTSPSQTCEECGKTFHFQKAKRSKCFACSPHKCTNLIAVKTLSGRTIMAVYSPSMSVSALQRNVAGKMGKPPNSIRLIYAGKTLVEDRMCADYNLQKSATLHAMPRTVEVEKDSAAEKYIEPGAKGAIDAKGGIEITKENLVIDERMERIKKNYARKMCCLQ
mmetsp:Transcript_7587/g.10418  ORF Transcript_7587/g.10418 Transcript_7587/m.10418 type:complete len:164 (+) Transcript_7587:44-535(+)